MAKLAIVHCRLCKKEIDRNIEKEQIDWVMKSKNWYYHTKCYEDWINKKDDIHTKDLNEEMWKDAAYQFLQKDLKISINYQKFNSQWNNFVKTGKTPKGIYFSLRYFYSIKNGNKEDAKEGIGIIPYIYNESCAYWVEREHIENGICKKIEEQIRQKENQLILTRRVKRKEKNKDKGNLSKVLRMELINNED